MIVESFIHYYVYDVEFCILYCRYSAYFVNMYCRCFLLLGIEIVVFVQLSL